MLKKNFKNLMDKLITNEELFMRTSVNLQILENDEKDGTNIWT